MGKILIADDSSFQRRILGDMVESLGHEVKAVESGLALLEAIDEEAYDCICLDLLMPEMTGVEVLEKLRQRNNQTPVIVISADIQHKKKEQCFELGAKAFINKYIEKEDLEKEFNRQIKNR